MIEQAFLQFSAEKLAQYRDRIHDCAGRLSDEQMWLRNADNSNAAGNLVLHLCGNVRQWIGHGVAGQSDHRDRDSEFAARGGMDRAALLAKLDEVVDAAISTIEDLSPEILLQRRTIQGYDVTVMEAVYHVVEHFGQHTGQIIFATKLLTGEDPGYYRHLSGEKHGEATP